MPDVSVISYNKSIIQIANFSELNSFIDWKREKIYFLLFEKSNIEILKKYKRQIYEIFNSDIDWLLSNAFSLPNHFRSFKNKENDTVIEVITSTDKNIVFDVKSILHKKTFDNYMDDSRKSLINAWFGDYIATWISLDQYLKYTDGIIWSEIPPWKRKYLLFDEAKLWYNSPTRRKMRYFWAIEMLDLWYEMSDIEMSYI